MWRYCEKNSDVIWYCESQCERNSSHIVTHIVRRLWENCEWRWIPLLSKHSKWAEQPGQYEVRRRTQFSLGKAKFKLQLLNRASREWCWLLLCGELSTRSLQKKVTHTQVKKSSFYTPKKTGCTLVDKRKAVEFYADIWFWFLTEDTLLWRRAPIKEALPSPNVLPVLILTPQTCQLTNQL